VALGRARRGEVYLVALDPTRGREIRKTRPCAVVSPNELNVHLQTVIVAPLTTAGHPYPFRVPCRFQRRDGYVVLDQLRTVDGGRLRRRLGHLSGATLSAVLRTLQEMFVE
jgi:mRNA interferase MazF